MDKSIVSKKTQINFASSFRKPALAVFQGEAVRITHLGDAEGMSPVYNVVDSLGQSAWVPQSDVTIIDPDYLPASQDALDSLTSNGTSRLTSRTPAGSRS